MVGGGGGVLLPPVVIQWVVDSYVALHGHPHGHVDGAHHGDGGQRVQKMWKHEDVEVTVQSKCAHGVKQHGDQVDEIKHGEDCQQLSECVPELAAKQEEDGYGVSQHTKTGEKALKHSFKNEMKVCQFLKNFI